jgi:hypothetical protein
MQNKNLDKYLKPIKFYQTLKSVGIMIVMVLKDLKWEVFHLLLLIFQMLIVYFRDFLKTQDSIVKMIKISLVQYSEEEIKMEELEEVWDSDFLQCLTMMISLVLDLVGWVVVLNLVLMMNHLQEEKAMV